MVMIHIHAGIRQGPALILRRVDVGIAQPQVDHIFALVFHAGQDHIHCSAQIGIEGLQSFRNFHDILRLYVILIIDVGNTAQKGRCFRVADVFHAMGLQAGNINKIPGPANYFFDHFIVLRIILIAFELTAQNVHGLVIKMIVNRYFPPGLGCEKPQTVFGIARAVITVL